MTQNNEEKSTLLGSIISCLKTTVAASASQNPVSVYCHTEQRADGGIKAVLEKRGGRESGCVSGSEELINHVYD